MFFLRKKEKPVAVEQKCPVEGCTYATTETINLKKHIEWKHPGLAYEGEVTTERAE